MNKIIPDGDARARMIKGLAEVKAKLKRGGGGAVHPSEMAADIILREIVRE